ncbi:RNA polymerase sigma factor [Proteiniclasticum ruminis]|uniref:RNA polymerase sigma-70 factor, ECF subfamily n=1 Tax=Proteiniclasticum ruminis TaxID=398199 RepID=A0A1G8SJH9_9CLOT|nr:sigma-70 family RNA polymerase sigma factor [Proteiniclasticum ruminis]SDJ28780.1 RNA polymerase sigma-70 factor, ECF subfamily [Proteiniclasticum ruminis]
MEDFSELYEEEAKKVYKFLLALTENELLAEELTQQTFYKALLSMKQFQGKSSIYTWLCQIGKNEWLQELRRKKLLSTDPMADRSSGNHLEEEYIRKHQIDMVRMALLGLPEPYRDVMILRTYGELPFSEIAVMYDRTESWAKVTFFRGKQKLKVEMEALL